MSSIINHQTIELRGDNFLDRALNWGDEIAQILSEREYSVVHVRSVWEGTPALLLQPRRGYRLVYEVNGLPSIELKYHYPGLNAHRELIGRLRSQERALLRAADRILTPSQTTRKYLRAQGASGDRTRVIPNGVDTSRFRGETKPLPQTPQLLYLGTLAPWQGVPFLLRALRLIADETPILLSIAGGGRREWRRECETLIRKLNLSSFVEMTPPVAPAEVPQLLEECDIAVAPLTITDRNVLQGCCPIKILEYMAAARPIVASRLPAVEELLEHEKTALLFKPDKPRRLADAILRLMREPERARGLADEAAKTARESFTWEKHNAAIAAVYEGLLG